MKTPFLYTLLAALLMALATPACQSQTKPAAKAEAAPAGSDAYHKSKAEWKKELSPEAYYVMFEQGTERPYTGKYWDNHEAGTYLCGACKQQLFSSATKFESGTGWPSFYQPLRKSAVVEVTDPDGMRTEVHCSRCGAHLGHVFNDGPKPTGLRYCMNSVSLDFKKQ